MTQETTLTLPKLTVPGFLLAGMEQRDGLQCAKVKSHEEGVLVLVVGGIDAQVKLESETLFKPDVWVSFNPDGSVQAVEGGEAGLKPARKARTVVKAAPARSGCNDTRNQKLF